MQRWQNLKYIVETPDFPMVLDSKERIKILIIHYISTLYPIQQNNPVFSIHRLKLINWDISN